jgi:hypothetical protein
MLKRIAAQTPDFPHHHKITLVHFEEKRILKLDKAPLMHN